MRLLNADALEREGWSLCRTFQKDKDTMVYEVKKPSDFPAIEPERTGKWIEYDYSHCECPFCHEEWNYFDNEVERFNRCPNCGARMES